MRLSNELQEQRKDLMEFDKRLTEIDSQMRGEKPQKEGEMPLTPPPIPFQKSQPTGTEESKEVEKESRGIRKPKK